MRKYGTMNVEAEMGGAGTDLQAQLGDERSSSVLS